MSSTSAADRENSLSDCSTSLGTKETSGVRTRTQRWCVPSLFVLEILHRARDRSADGNVRFGEQLKAAVAKAKKLEGKVFQSDAQDLQLPEGFERSFDKVFTSASSSSAPPGPFPLHTCVLHTMTRTDQSGTLELRRNPSLVQA